MAIIWVTVIRSVYFSQPIMIEDIAELTKSLARPQLILPDGKPFAVDTKRIEGTMAAISGHPVKKVDPAVVISISPIHGSM